MAALSLDPGPDRARRLLPPLGRPHRQAQGPHRHRAQARYPRLSHLERHARLSRPGRRHLHRAPTITAVAPTPPPRRHPRLYPRQPRNRGGTRRISFLGMAESVTYGEGHGVATSLLCERPGLGYWPTHGTGLPDIARSPLQLCRTESRCPSRVVACRPCRRRRPATHPRCAARSRGDRTHQIPSVRSIEPDYTNLRSRSIHATRARMGSFALAGDRGSGPKSRGWRPTLVVNMRGVRSALRETVGFRRPALAVSRSFSGNYEDSGVPRFWRGRGRPARPQLEGGAQMIAPSMSGLNEPHRGPVRSIRVRGPGPGGTCTTRIVVI